LTDSVMSGYSSALAQQMS